MFQGLKVIGNICPKINYPLLNEPATTKRLFQWEKLSYLQACAWIRIDLKILKDKKKVLKIKEENDIELRFKFNLKKYCYIYIRFNKSQQKEYKKFILDLRKANKK